MILNIFYTGLQHISTFKNTPRFAMIFLHSRDGREIRFHMIATYLISVSGAIHPSLMRSIAAVKHALKPDQYP